MWDDLSSSREGVYFTIKMVIQKNNIVTAPCFVSPGNLGTGNSEQLCLLLLLMDTNDGN